MALWQLKTEMIPTERVRGRAQIEPAEFEEALWWSDRQPPVDYRKRLASLLPPTKSWHERLLRYGDEQADRIDVWVENGRVESIGVRIDCRQANVLFLEGLLRLAQEWSCNLVELRYLKILPAELPAFVRAVSESPSCRWMAAPASWLPKLAAEVRAAESIQRPRGMPNHDGATGP